MDLVAGAVGSIVSKLGELLKAEYKLQKGLPEQIESLKKELESAHMALCKVGETPPEQLDPQVRLWARQVREASYDMEDILDTFLVEVVEGAATAETESKNGLRKRLKNGLFKKIEGAATAETESKLAKLFQKMAKLFQKSKARRDIAGAIEDMQRRLQEVSDRRDRNSIPVAVPAPAAKLDPRLVQTHNKAAQIIGIERTREELIAMLQSSTHGRGEAGTSGSSNPTKIVSVVGAGGLGKTTLARAVYDELSPGYDCRAFVSVGRKPDLVQVFTSIFFYLDQQKYKAIRDVKDLQLLIGNLREFLESKRYFIVIDDVWDIESWGAIASALAKNNRGSRIVKTTRNREVAWSDDVYELDPLSHDNSNKLFCMRLYGEDKCPASHPEEASEKILGKCGGVPLAIITMASLLVGKSIQHWNEVCNSPGFYQDKNKRRMENTMEKWPMENTMDILSLSYYDLPSHLKTCLLYLSIYPEDSLIEKDSLIWKWIAEGFVQKIPGRGFFEVGEEYFHVLINRSLIQRVDSDVYGIIEACRAHDMVLDLIVSMSCEENFVSVDGTLAQSHTRRLALKNRELDLTQDTHVNMPQVRTFVAWQCAINKWALHPRLKLIRVLALENCTFREGCPNLEHIGNLLHLRYLGFRYSSFEELPEGIGELKFLQTLDLDWTGYRELPCSIGKLEHLVCLRLEHLSPAADGVIGKLTSLEELQIADFTGVMIDAPENGESLRQFVKDLGNLSELRMLKIESEYRIGNMDEATQTAFMNSLGSLKKMQHLKLGIRIDPVHMNAWESALPCRDLRCLFLPDVRFPKLPSSINSADLPILSHLDICVLDVDEQGLEALGRLPELCYLKLYTDGAATSNTEAVGCFQKLRSLVLENSMVQFVANEDSSASFTIFRINRGRATGTSRKKEDYRVVAPAVAVMPNLEELEFYVSVKELMVNNVVSCEDLGLEYLPSLRRVEVELCYDAYADDVVKEEAALRNAVDVHPNRPTLQIVDSGKERMKRRSDDDDSV